MFSEILLRKLPVFLPEFRSDSNCEEKTEWTTHSENNTGKTSEGNALAGGILDELSRVPPAQAFSSLVFRVLFLECVVHSVISSQFVEFLPAFS